MDVALHHARTGTALASATRNAARIADATDCLQSTGDVGAEGATIGQCSEIASIKNTTNELDTQKMKQGQLLTRSQLGTCKGEVCG